MSEVKTPTKQKVLKTEAIVGTAAAKLTAATTNLKSAVETATKLVEIVETQTLQIAVQEEKLANLTTEYTNKKNQQDIELRQAFQAEQKACADTYLNDNNLVAVDKTKYQELETSLTTLKSEFDAKLASEVGKAKGIATTEAANAAKLAEAEYKAKEAGNIAKIENLQAQLIAANNTADQWKTQLDEERKHLLREPKQVLLVT